MVYPRSQSCSSQRVTTSCRYGSSGRGASRGSGTCLQSKTVSPGSVRDRSGQNGNGHKIAVQQFAVNIPINSDNFPIINFPVIDDDDDDDL